MAKERKSRDAWVAAAVQAMGEGGIDAVRVERLARDLGVTKGSFYWHFENRSELLQALLDAWEQSGTQAIIHAVQEAGGTPAARLKRLWRLTNDDGEIGPELALRDWARRDPAVAKRVQHVDNERMGFLRQLLTEQGASQREAEARAMLLYSLLIGTYFIAATHGRRSRKSVLADALALLIDG